MTWEPSKEALEQWGRDGLQFAETLNALPERVKAKWFGPMEEPWYPTEGPGSGDDKYSPKPGTEVCVAPTVARQGRTIDCQES